MTIEADQEFYRSPDSKRGNKKSNTKRRRNKFLSNAKKFGQKGNFGKGFEVEVETFQYFLRVMDLFQKNAFDSEEDKGKVHV